MKELLLDLTTISEEAGDEWADSPARAWLEQELLKYSGRIIRVRITLARPHYHRHSIKETNEKD